MSEIIHLVAIYAKLSKKNNISYLLMRTCTCVYEEINDRFLESFPYVLNE